MPISESPSLLGSGRRGARSLTIAALLAALLGLSLPAGATAQSRLRVILSGGFVHHTQAVPAGQTVRFTVTCPPPMRAVAGAVSAIGAHSIALLSVPTATGAWAFGLRNTDPAAADTVTVVVTCVRPRLIVPAGLKVKPLQAVRTATATRIVPPGATATVGSDCPKGTRPVGVGEVLPGGEKHARAAFAAGDVRTTAVTLEGRRGAVTVRNTGAVSARVRSQSVCLPTSVSGSTATGRQVRLGTGVQLGGVEVTVSAGNRFLSTNCRSGQGALTAGYRFASDADLLIAGTALSPGTPNVRWFIANRTPAAVRMQIELVCANARFALLTAGQRIDTTVGPITISG